jgi:glycosylphosphatidylinositol transamidase
MCCPNFYPCSQEGIPGVNIVGIVRAPQSEGNEAVVLVTPFSVEGMLSTGDRLALGFGMALFELWGNSNWLAKDVIWVLADSRYSAYTAVAAWLQEYHEPRFDLPKDWGFSDPSTQAWLYAGKKLDGETLLDFKRAGTIAAGLVLYVTSGDGGVADCIKVSAEGPNGQMPNLDLINVVNSLAVWRQGLHMRVDTFADMQESASLNYLGQFLEKIGQLAGKVQADWGFVLTASMYVEGLATLFASVKNQVGCSSFCYRLWIFQIALAH